MNISKKFLAGFSQRKGHVRNMMMTVMNPYWKKERHACGRFDASVPKRKYKKTSNPAKGASTRMDDAMPRAVAAMTILFVLSGALLSKESIISNPKQSAARKKVRKGGSFGFMNACPHINGWKENSAVMKNAADGLNHRFEMRYRK